MAELEEMGYLLQPHTSAGRIPTPKGYRLYVDELMGEDQTSIFEEDFLEGTYLALKREDPHVLLQETTRMLSLLSHYAGIVLAPKVSKARLDRMEFILVRKGHALAVQVSRDGLIQHRMIDVDPELTQRDLTRIGAFLNEKFSGLSLDEIRRRLVQEMEAEKELYNHLYQKASEIGQKALAEQPEEELFLVGTSNILNLPEFTENLEKMKALFKTFEEKALILRLLNNCLDTEGVQIFIGSESSLPAIEDFSLVVANYRSGDEIGGTLGVIGPTRMEYNRVIPLVDHTAKVISRLLDQD